MPSTLSYSNLSELPIIAQQIIDFAGNTKIWLFEGPMGAGKTTLIQQIAKTLGVTESTSSPTYSLVNEYLTDKNQTIYHFDFYRLKSEIEALDYGIEEYFESNNICLCEWPSKIPSLWPAQYLMIKIELDNSATRQISLDLYSL
jgi:tRNA threonylcarbamoyladenosine biosynthesis protein TsaE